MPVVNQKPTYAPSLPPREPAIAPKQFKSNVIDTQFNPLSSLITFVEGSLWTIDYYDQVIDTDSEIRGQDVGQGGVYQQYRRIQGLEIKVVNPLSWSQDANTKMITANGSANVHSFIIPVEGNMFAADVGDGREGIFQITMTEKKSLLKESAYYIEYTFMYYSDQDPARRADLDKKTVVSLHYSRDFLMHGQNPLLSTDDYQATENLKYLYFEIIRNYMQWFFSREFKTLLLPGQPYSVYDPRMTEFFMSIVTTRDQEDIRYTRVLNVEDDYALTRQTSLLRALKLRDKTQVRLGNVRAGLVNVELFNSNTQLNGIRYSGVKYVVYPLDPKDNVDASSNVDARNLKATSYVDLQPAPTPGGYVGNILYADEIKYGDVVRPLINPVLQDDYYILSKAFYTKVGKESVLETLVDQYLNREAIDPKVLVQVLAAYTNWGGLESFYYLPIALCLIKAVTRTY
jgi:hypothetical protein